MWRVMQSAAGPVKVRPKGAACASTRPSRLVTRAMPNWQVLSIRRNHASCTGIDKVAPAFAAPAPGSGGCGSLTGARPADAWADLSDFHPPRLRGGGREQGCSMRRLARRGIAACLAYETSLLPCLPQNIRTKARDYFAFRSAA